MEKISGKIKAIDVASGITNNQSWKRWTFTINDKLYSTFDSDIGKEFDEGDNVIMTGEMKGKYWTLKTMEHDESAVEPETKDIKVLSKSTPRTSEDITATELIRYAVKLAEIKKEGDFEVICQNIFDEFDKFRSRLKNNTH